MTWVAYLLAVCFVAGFFVGRGTANFGAYQRGYDDGRDDAHHDLSAQSPSARPAADAEPELSSFHADNVRSIGTAKP